MTDPRHTAEHDLMHDLDAMTGLAGKDWSVALARRMGLSEQELRMFLSRNMDEGK